MRVDEHTLGDRWPALKATHSNTLPSDCKIGVTHVEMKLGGALGLDSSQPCQSDRPMASQSMASQLDLYNVKCRFDLCVVSSAKLTLNKDC